MWLKPPPRFAATGVETVVVTEIADLHPQPKRTLINFLVKYVKKMVPAFSIPGALKLITYSARAPKRRIEPSF
ncbi:MAG: hypothetical protein CM15mP74_04960 [Halieaceae bacterium]|nr:MAG: hypothetical protein CM15mP74_04960 [Halieaceae bacterium]